MDHIEQQREEWRKKAGEVAKNVVAPRAAQIDETGEFAWDLVEEYSKHGFLSLLIPKEYGGMDADTTSFCLIAEQIANYCASSALLVIVQAVGTMPLALGGTQELKENFLTRLVQEKALICFCLTEPEAGSDSASIRTKAVLKGDHYLLNGRKCFITNGGVANFYTVFAVTNPGLKMEGISSFVVKKGSPGLSIGKTEEKMGIRGSNTTEVILEDVRVPVRQRIGDEGAGWWQMMRTLNRSRPAIGAQAVGLAQGALNYVIRFLQEKGGMKKKEETWGEMGMLVDMATQIEAARALVYKSANMMDEKAKGTPVQVFSAMSKYFASDVAMKVTTDAVQILQWQGLTKNHPVERMMRDAKVIQIFEGTNQIQRMVVAHTLLKSR
jgi:alkylation response protein AidB-like acyl-CoA dehydrogenase